MTYYAISTMLKIMNEGNTYKAKITTNRGTFEFEGNQEFVEKQIEKIVDIEKSSPAPPPADDISKSHEKTTKKKGSSNGSARKPSVEQPKMLPDLVAKDKISSLKDFYASKNPESHIETYAVLTYWLKENADLSEASIDEMWTLYRVLGQKPPKVLIQTFRDGKSKKSYFELSKSGKYYITSIGETFVEHDLPRNPKKK